MIVVKGGRFAAGARAAATHTGAMMGRDEVYEAVFRRTGMVRVYTLQELFNAAETLSRVHRLRGERLAILTNGGGLAVLAADALASLEGTLATLGDDTVAALDALLPPNWSRANPVDVIGDADPARFAAAAKILAADKGIDALMIIHCPTAVCPGADAARAVIDALAGQAHRRSCSPAGWEAQPPPRHASCSPPRTCRPIPRPSRPSAASCTR